MPRKRRIEIDDGYRHILNRGVGGKNIFLDDEDFEKFINCIANTQELYPFVLFGYSILPDHFHILIEKIADPVSSIMKSLLGSYAGYYNRRYSRSGRVFKGRYLSYVCQKGKLLPYMVNYIHLNPVRYELVRDPCKWKWSSIRAYSGNDSRVSVNTSEVMNALAGSKLADLRSFTEQWLDSPCGFEIYPAREFPVVGDSRFKKDIRDKMNKYSDAPRREYKQTISWICTSVCRDMDISMSEVRSPGGSRKISRARAYMGYIACVTYGCTVTRVANYIRKDVSTITHAVNRMKKEKRESEDIQLKRIIKIAADDIEQH